MTTSTPTTEQLDSIEKLHARLNEWKSELNDLQSRSERALLQTKLELDRKFGDLENKTNELEKSLVDFKLSEEQDWLSFAEGFAESVREMKTALHDASSEYFSS